MNPRSFSIRLVVLISVLILNAGCTSIGARPTHYAYEGNYAELANMSLSDLKEQVYGGKYKNDPLFVASDARRSNIIELLVSKGLQVTSEHLAAAITDIGLAYSYHSVYGTSYGYAEKGRIYSQPEYNTKNQRSPLASLKALLGGNFDPNILTSAASIQIGRVNDARWHSSRINFVGTPLTFAARWGSIEEVAFLLKKGANPNIGIGASSAIDPSALSVSNYRPPQDEMTPLHIAALYNRPEVIKLLIDNGANPNARTTAQYCDRSTARMELGGVFSDDRYIEGTTFCVESGATPLHFAASRNALNAAQMLVQSGSRVDIRTNNGKSINDVAGDYFATLQRSKAFDARKTREAEESNAMWGKLLTIAAGNAFAANHLNAEQFAKFSSAFTQDVMSGTTSNTQNLTDQLRQEQATKSQSAASNNGADEGPTINEQYSFTCPSGDSHTIPIQAKSQQCASAMKTYGRAAGCNLIDEMPQAEKNYYSACAAEMY